MYQRRLQIPLTSSLLMVLYTEISELFCTSFRLVLVSKILLKTRVFKRKSCNPIPTTRVGTFDVVLVTIFVSRLDDLQLDNAITMAPRMVSFDWVFYKLSEKLRLLTFNQGKKAFGFLMGTSS